MTYSLVLNGRQQCFHKCSNTGVDVGIPLLSSSAGSSDLGHTTGYAEGNGDQ